MPRDTRSTNGASCASSMTGCNFAVAETGSVLFSESELKINTLAYLAQHLVVLLSPAAIVPGMQDAYNHPSFRTARYAVLHTRGTI